MYRNLLLGTAAIALAAFASPARAQLAPGDVEIEGPMSVPVPAVYPAPEVTNTPQGPRTSVGEITVLGIKVKVLQGALIHTPTNANLGLTGTPPVTDTAAGLTKLTTGPLPGRGNQPGFVGGTAIVVGESIGGQVYATDVFSDLFEHVVVGEATAPVVVGPNLTRSTVNGMTIRRSTDDRMPAGPPINGFGLRVEADAIRQGTLVAAEGYFVPSQNTLWYHTLEADGAPLVDEANTQVSILRANCRIRGGGRDEIEVRGGVTRPANATVQIRIQLNPVSQPNVFTTIGTATAVADNTQTPPQGLFRADFRNLRIAAGVCPTLVRAVIPQGAPNTTRQAVATADMEGR